MPKNKGFTVTELLVSIAILGFLLGVSITSFVSFSRHDSVLAATTAVTQALRDARARTLASVAGSQYGVKVDADRFTFFQGSTFSSSTPNNSTFLFSAGVKASSTLSTIVFERVTGNSSASGTIDIYQASSVTILKHIRVQTTGLVSIE